MPLIIAMHASLFLAALVLFPVFSECRMKTANAIEREQNILLYVVYPRVFDAMVSDGIESPVQIRAIFYLNMAHFNAWVNYHPTAVDIFGRAPNRRPKAEHTLENKNIAGLYSMYRVYIASPHSFGGPAGIPNYRKLFADLGFDPDVTRTTGGDAIAVGNWAGYETARLVLNDGWNAEGDQTVSVQNYQLPFQDTTGYNPVNEPGVTPRFPLRWAPLLETDQKGAFFRQSHVVPQAGNALTYSISRSEVNKRRLDPPYKNGNAQFGMVSPVDFTKLKNGAKEVFRVSRRLTERQRVLAELFDNKVVPFRNAQNPAGVAGIAGTFRLILLANVLDWNYDEEMVYGMAANLLSYDSTVLVWKEKLRHDAVRPTGDTMSYLFGNARQTVWGGPGKGPKSIRASAWQSYIRTMPHSEFPSASACLCAALAEHALLQTKGAENLPFNVTVPKGSSVFYPGRLPGKNVTIEIKTLSEWGTLCGESRLYAGVHFPQAIPAGERLCKKLAPMSQNAVDLMIAGTYKPVWKRDLSKNIANIL